MYNEINVLIVVLLIMGYNQVNVSLVSNLSACNISKENCLLQSDAIDVDFIPESDNDLSEKQKVGYKSPTS